MGPGLQATVRGLASSGLGAQPCQVKPDDRALQIQTCAERESRSKFSVPWESMAADDGPDAS